LQGFKAQVTREPTNIVVKIPTPPPVQEQVQQPHQYISVSPLLFIMTQKAFPCKIAGAFFVLSWHQIYSIRINYGRPIWCVQIISLQGTFCNIHLFLYSDQLLLINHLPKYTIAWLHNQRQNSWHNFEHWRGSSLLRLHSRNLYQQQQQRWHPHLNQCSTRECSHKFSMHHNPKRQD
jgi:hypothetical protein